MQPLLRLPRSAPHRAFCGRSPSGKRAAAAIPEPCVTGLAVLRAAPCASRRPRLNPLHRPRRHAVGRTFLQHHRLASTLRGRDAVGRGPRLAPGPATEGASIVQRRTEGPPGRSALRSVEGGAPRSGTAGSVPSPGQWAVDTEVWGSLYGASRRGPEEKPGGSDGLSEDKKSRSGESRGT